MSTLSTAARNAACDAVVDLVDGGSGSNGTLVFLTSGDAEVATLTFANPAFGAAAVGVATANAITREETASGGTIAKAEVRDTDGTVVWEPTVTATGGGGEIELSTLTPNAGEPVEISSFTFTVPES